ncbi:hypothetical protein AAD018_005860 [Aestuariibius insulae]|uniref:hypothetical protein n=1 Tax=Aestuariibius insulae TaxID=2058287 RepID=UPI00345E9DC8
MALSQDRGGRKLTAGEITLLREIFATGVIFDLVRIHNGYIDDEAKKDFPGRSHASGNDIYLVGDDWRDDLSESEKPKHMATLVHEVAHIWQHQNGIKSALEESDHHNLTLSDHYEFMGDIYWNRLQRKIKELQRKYEGLTKEAATDSIAAKDCVLIDKMHNAFEKEYYYNTLYKKDKGEYWEAEAWDPVFEFGPQPEYQTAWAIYSNDRFLSHLGAAAQPRVGERLSDFLWRTSTFVQGRFKTKNKLVDAMRDAAFDDTHEHHSSLSDYNYMMQTPGSVSFLTLRTEAQAQLVTDYFLIKRGHDPRIVMSGGDLRPRPPLSFYKSIIPFLPQAQPFRN